MIKNCIYISPFIEEIDHLHPQRITMILFRLLIMSKIYSKIITVISRFRTRFRSGFRIRFRLWLGIRIRFGSGFGIEFRLWLEIGFILYIEIYIGAITQVVYQESQLTYKGLTP